MGYHVCDYVPCLDVNGTDCNTACIYSSDIARALRVAGKIEAGTVAINSAYLPDIQAPWGGFKQSGQGRECGKAGLDAYLQAKTIKINMNSPNPH